MREDILSEHSKTIVMIGGFTHEGIKTSVEALGYQIADLSLDKVTPKTWLKRANFIKQLRESGRLAATVIYLHSPLLLKASTELYRESFLAILNEVRTSKTIVFVFQDNLDGIFVLRHRDNHEPMTLRELRELLNDVPAWSYFRQVRIESSIEFLENYGIRAEETKILINALYDSGAEIAPFFRRSDVTIRLQEFLEDLDGKVFLRLFIPNDRLQAEQLKSLLGVLERYMRQIEQQDFSVDSHKSEKGIVYIFKAEANLINIQRFNDAFLRFDTFMKLCGDDPSHAEVILKNKGFSGNDVAFIVDKYARDYKRLILDTKHEFERKTLMLRQNLERDVFEDHAIPLVSWTNEGIPGLLSAAATGGNVQINVGSISVKQANKIHNEVNKIVNNSLSYNDNDKILIELFSRYADGFQALQCRSDLDQLKDKSVPETSRKNAKQRLLGFLRKAAKKAGQIAEKVAVETLSNYLESLIKSG